MSKPLHTKKILKDWFYYESYRMSPESVDEKAGTLGEIENKIKALFICAAADGKISEAEKNWIFGSALLRGTSLEFIEKLQHTPLSESEDVLDKLRHSHRALPESKRLMYNVLRACGADGDISKEERSKIMDFAKKLHLSDDFILNLFELFNREQTLKQEIKQLLT